MSGYNPEDPFDYGSSNNSSPSNKYSMTSSENENGSSSNPFESSPYGGSNPYGNTSQGGKDPFSYVTDYSTASSNAAAANRGVRGFESAAQRAVSIPDVLSYSFLYMFLGLLVTGFTALLSIKPLVSMINSSGITPLYVFMFLEIAVVFAANAAMSANNVTLSFILYFAYAILNGFTLSVIFLVYTASSIANVFFITAALFGVMAAVGIFTKKDLTGLGSMCFFGLIGIIIAGIVNMFFKSSQLDFFITVIGIIIFTGLTAYDAQKIKERAYTSSGYSTHVLGLWGALQLYLDFVNLFLKLLRILGKRKR